MLVYVILSGHKNNRGTATKQKFWNKNVFQTLNIFLFYQQIPVVVKLQISLVVAKIIGLPLSGSI